MSKRIYLTTDQTGTHRLTKSTTPSQAVAHHARSTIKVRIASQSDLVNLLPVIPVEEAGVEASGDAA